MPKHPRPGFPNFSVSVVRDACGSKASKGELASKPLAPETTISCHQKTHEQYHELYKWSNSSLIILPFQSFLNLTFILAIGGCG